MASGHFLCLLVFIAFSISSLHSAFGTRSLLTVSSTSEHDDQQAAADEQALFPFKKFLKLFHKHKFHYKHKLPFKHKFKFPPRIKFPPHRDATVATEGTLSATTKKDLDGSVVEVLDEKFSPKFKFPPQEESVAATEGSLKKDSDEVVEVHDEKFLPKFKFPFKFFPKKKFPPKFKFPPHDASVVTVESLSIADQDSKGAVEVHDEKFLPKFKFPKFFFPKKKFPPKFKFPPLTEEASNPSGKISSATVVPVNYATEATTATTKTKAP